MKPRKKTTRKKKRKNIIDDKTKRRVIVSANVGCAWILDWRSANVAKTVNDSKAVRRQLEELQRHGRAMEQGRGLYLAPHKYGRGLYLSLYKHG